MKYVLVFFWFLFFSCVQEKTHKETNAQSSIVDSSTRKYFIDTDKLYLTQSLLNNYIYETPSISIQNTFHAPFDTLKFDKVIAYDFEGSEEPFPSIFEGSKFVPVVLRQQALNVKQIDYLIKFLTDKSTYGGITALCFRPHLAFVFYENNRAKCVINVCLGCNYLESTVDIRESLIYKHKKVYRPNGFSLLGKKKIIKLCKQINFEYGKEKLQ